VNYECGMMNQVALRAVCCMFLSTDYTDYTDFVCFIHELPRINCKPETGPLRALREKNWVEC